MVGGFHIGHEIGTQEETEGFYDMGTFWDLPGKGLDSNCSSGPKITIRTIDYS